MHEFTNHEFFEFISGWDISEIYINSVCVQSCFEKTYYTLSEALRLVEQNQNNGIDVKWTSVEYRPSTKGVSIHITLNVNLWQV